MKAVITGATGFCGTHLRNYLQSQGVETVALPRPPTIDDVNGLAASLRNLAPDYVFHLAGIVHASTPVEFYRVNTLYAATLLQALSEAGLAQTPVLLAGTAAEYGVPLPEHLPLTEEAPVRPVTHYGASKLAQTHLGRTVARTDKRPIVATRPFNIIGTGMPGHLAIQSFVEQIASIQRGERPPFLETGNLASKRDFVDVEDLVRIYWSLIREPKAYGEVVNICTGVATGMTDVLAQLIALSALEIEVGLDPARRRANDTPVHMGSPEKLISLIGMPRFTQLKTTLQKICAEHDLGARRPSL